MVNIDIFWYRYISILKRKYQYMHSFVFCVILGAVFGDRLRNMSRSPLYHKMEIFGNKISRKLRKTKTFTFEGFLVCEFQNTVPKWTLCTFEYSFLGSIKTHVKEPTVPQNGIFSFRLMPGFLRSPQNS